MAHKSSGICHYTNDIIRKRTDTIAYNKWSMETRPFLYYQTRAERPIFLHYQTFAQVSRKKVILSNFAAGGGKVYIIFLGQFFSKWQICTYIYSHDLLIYICTRAVNHNPAPHDANIITSVIFKDGTTNI